MLRLPVSLVLVAACGSGGGNASPDASPDSNVVIPTGNFTCVGQPRTMTAPDPLHVGGKVMSASGAGLGGAAVEIHAVSDDALLGTATTGSGPTNNVGNYTVAFATGGVAPEIYRKSTASGKIDTYLYDAFPMFFSTNGPQQYQFTAQENSDYYTMFGLQDDPTKATIDLIVLDCPDQSGANIGATRGVAGATVIVAGAEREVYLDEAGAPAPSATTTSKAGYVTAFNVPPGPLDITIVAGPYTYRKPAITARAGAYTVAFVSP